MRLLQVHREQRSNIEVGYTLHKVNDYDSQTVVLCFSLNGSKNMRAAALLRNASQK